MEAPAVFNSSRPMLHCAPHGAGRSAETQHPHSRVCVFVCIYEVEDAANKDKKQKAGLNIIQMNKENYTQSMIFILYFNDFFLPFMYSFVCP